MSDYTPTTEEVQSRYVYAADFTVSEEVDAWGEFDRWLAAHDAKVYQRGREDAAEAILDLHCDLHDDGPNEECLVRASSAAAAARGDGEQA